MTMTREHPASLSSPGSAEPPPAVRKATTALFVLIGLGLAWSLFLLVGALAAAATDGESSALVAIPVAMVAVDVLFLYLTWKVRQGSRPAWITMLVVLGIQVALVLAVVASEPTAEMLGGGLLMLLVPAAALLYLVARRRSRRYFLDG